MSKQIIKCEKSLIAFCNLSLALLCQNSTWNTPPSWCQSRQWSFVWFTSLLGYFSWWWEERPSFWGWLLLSYFGYSRSSNCYMCIRTAISSCSLLFWAPVSNCEGLCWTGPLGLDFPAQSCWHLAKYPPWLRLFWKLVHSKAHHFFQIIHWQHWNTFWGSTQIFHKISSAPRLIWYSSCLTLVFIARIGIERCLGKMKYRCGFALPLAIIDRDWKENLWGYRACSIDMSLDESMAEQEPTATFCGL